MHIFSLKKNSYLPKNNIQFFILEMTSNSTKTPEKFVQCQNNLPKIIVQPKDYISFVYSKTQSVGIIHIYLQSFANSVYEFQIKSTNKLNYKVEEHSGIIDKCPYLIYIHMSRFKSLEDTLSDRFKLLIIDKNLKKTVFSTKLGVIIEPNLNSPRQSGMSDSSNTSKGTSINSSPSAIGETALTRKPSLSSSLRLHQIDSKMLMKKGKKTAEAVTKTLEQQINESGKTLEKMKKKQMRLQEEIRNKKANQRFNLYFIIFIAMFGLFSGILGKFFWGQA